MNSSGWYGWSFSHAPARKVNGHLEVREDDGEDL
jgi:hypothetical protein